jgi:sugar phosphate isomerase/epimerase
MQVGIFAKTFERPNVDETFTVIADHNIYAVQFNMATAGLASLPDKVSDSEIQGIQRASKKCNVQLSALSGTFNMAHPDIKQRQDGLKRFRVLVEAAQQLEVPIITLCTGTRDMNNMWKYHPDNNSKEAWQDLCTTLEQALTLVQNTNLVLAFEPETSNVISSAKKGQQVLDEMNSPKLKVIIDGANLFVPEDLGRQKEVFAEAFGLLGGDIVLAHAKDMNAHGEFVAAGKGVIDYACFIKHLKAIHYTGTFILHSLTESEVPSSVGFLRQWLEI